MYKIEQSKEDVWSWSPARNGLFSTKIAYNILSTAADEEEDNTKKSAFKTL